MDINWHSGIVINGIQEPTYGNYGGLYYSAGGGPIDALDTLFQAHDARGGTGIYADYALLTGMVNLPDNQLDAEGHLYAGAAELGMIAALTREGYHFSAFELAYDTYDAIHNIQLGFAGLSPAETGLALNWAAQSAWQLLI